MQSHTLPGMTLNYKSYPPPSEAKPIVKWAGGKRSVIPHIGLGIHRALCNSGGRFIEPFAGGAAVASWLGWSRTILTDKCLPLITLYSEMIHNHRAIAEHVARTQRVAIPPICITRSDLNVQQSACNWLHGFCTSTNPVSTASIERTNPEASTCLMGSTNSRRSLRVNISGVGYAGEVVGDRLRGFLGDSQPRESVRCHLR